VQITALSRLFDTNFVKIGEARVLDARGGSSDEVLLISSSTI